MDPYDDNPTDDPYADPPGAAPDPAVPAPPAYRPPPLGGLQPAGFVCPSCQYDLTGAVIGGYCPECGQLIDPQALTSAATNGLAVTSMIMGIVALSLCWIYGIPLITFAPLGIIFGHIARHQLRSGRYSSGSSGFATAGLICSYIGLGLFIAVILFIVIIAML